MPSVSVFTPSHHNRYLVETYRSLLAQTDPDWQWTVVHNNGGEPFDCTDPRVTQHILYKAPEFVGSLKAYACEQATGDILLELDHDDLLAPTAIAKAKEAFADPKIVFSYSNSVHATRELEKPDRYSDIFGWRYREVDWDGHKLDEVVSFAPTPEAVSRIWFAPNHFRAFRRDAYQQVGGYAKDMRVLDDEDLMCRLYGQGEFRHIDEPLYLYRIHGENTWIKHNKEIQDNVWRLHDQYAEKLALAAARRRGLRAIELGAAFAKHDGYDSVDRVNADVRCDLERKWPFKDNSVGVIRAYDIFEHLRDPIHTMKECYRVLAPGGWIFAQVPSTDGRGAFQDPTHKSFWNENSWRYYTHRQWAQYIGTPVRFQAVRTYTTPKDAIGVCWTVAHLVSLKDGYRPPGIVEV